MEIKSVELPGIGYKISFITATNSKIILIIHHSGKREMFFFEDANLEEADFVINLNSDETRQLATELLGVTYQSIVTDSMEMFKDKILIEWIKLPENSPFVNKSIGDSNIGAKTGIAIVGIFQDDQNLLTIPDVETILNSKDTLIIIGKKDQMDAFIQMANPEKI